MASAVILVYVVQVFGLTGIVTALLLFALMERLPLTSRLGAWHAAYSLWVLAARLSRGLRPPRRPPRPPIPHRQRASLAGVAARAACIARVMNGTGCASSIAARIFASCQGSDPGPRPTSPDGTVHAQLLEEPYAVSSRPPPRQILGAFGPSTIGDLDVAAAAAKGGAKAVAPATRIRFLRVK